MKLIHLSTVFYSVHLLKFELQFIVTVFRIILELMYIEIYRDIAWEGKCGGWLNKVGWVVNVHFVNGYIYQTGHVLKKTECVNTQSMQESRPCNGINGFLLPDPSGSGARGKVGINYGNYFFTDCSRNDTIKLIFNKWGFSSSATYSSCVLADLKWGSYCPLMRDKLCKE